MIYWRFPGSLSDFEPAKHAVPTDQLAEIDRYMLGKLTETVKEVKPCLNLFLFISHWHVYLFSFYLVIHSSTYLFFD